VSGEDRKERVLHTRIPAALEEQIKRLAEALRVPVSNLVRNMLEDAIDVTRRVRDQIPHSEADFSSIFGWQGLTLNLSTPCARCGRKLEAGEEAYLGLTDRPREAKVFICSACLPRPSQQPQH
jgi:hypothetical protein